MACVRSLAYCTEPAGSNIECRLVHCRYRYQASLCTGGQSENSSNRRHCSQRVGPPNWRCCGLGSDPLCGFTPGADSDGLHAGVTLDEKRCTEVRKWTQASHDFQGCLTPKVFNCCFRVTGYDMCALDQSTSVFGPCESC